MILKIVVTTAFHMFKKLEERLNMLSRETWNMLKKNDPNQTRDENFSVQDAKPTGRDFLAEETLQKGTLVNLETLLIPIFLFQ